MHLYYKREALKLPFILLLVAGISGCDKSLMHQCPSPQLWDNSTFKDAAFVDAPRERPLKKGEVRIAYNFEFPDGSESGYIFRVFNSTAGVHIPFKYYGRHKRFDVEIQP